MSESKINTRTDARDSPYRRIAVLFGVILIGVLVLFGANVLARGFGGKERQLAQAFVVSMQEKYINVNYNASRQAQTNSFDIEGELHSVDLKDVSANLKFTAVAQSKTVEIPIDAYASLGKETTVYLKGSELNAVADMLGEAAPELNADIVSIANKIDGKWLVLPQADKSTGTCLTSLMEKMQSDEDAAKQIGKAYLNNRFIAVDSVDEKSATVQEYEARYMSDKLQGFMSDVKKQDVYTSIKSCKESSDTAASSNAQNPSPESESGFGVTIRVENGKITSVTSGASNEGRVETFSMAVNYKKGEELVPPSEDLVKISTIQAEMTSISRFIIEQQAAAAGQTAQ